MTETVTKVSIAELNVVRVTCKKCEATVEIGIDRVASAIDGQACTVCNAALLRDNERDVLLDLRQSIRRLQNLNGVLEIHFVVKENDE